MGPFLPIVENNARAISDFDAMENDMMALLSDWIPWGVFFLTFAGLIFAGVWKITRALDGFRVDLAHEFKDVRSDMHAMENRLSGRIGKVESAIAVLSERIDGRTKALKGLVDDCTRETKDRLARFEVRFDHKFGRSAPAKTPEIEERETVPA